MASIFFLFASCSPLIFAGTSLPAAFLELPDQCDRSSLGCTSSSHSLCTATSCCSARARSPTLVAFSGCRPGVERFLVVLKVPTCLQAMDQLFIVLAIYAPRPISRGSLLLPSQS